MPTDITPLVHAVFALWAPGIPAFVFYRLLPSSSNVEGPFAGLRIKLGGAFGGYFVLVLVTIGVLKTMSTPQDRPWTVMGHIEFNDGKTQYYADDLTWRQDPFPLRQDVETDGEFEIEIHARPDDWIELAYPGYVAKTIQLKKDGVWNATTREIRLRERIVLTKKSIGREPVAGDNHDDAPR